MVRACSMLLMTTFLLASAIATSANAGVITTFDFDFTAQCDDCAFLGSPSDIDFDPLGDGLFETVTGTLRLSDVTPNVNGFIDVDSNNFHSFTYDGSSLINPFTFDDAFTIRGLLSPSGAVQAAEALRLETSDGAGGVFDFPNFCTALGQQVLGCDDPIGLVTVDVDSGGSWSISGSVPFDVGENAQLVAVPEPTSVALLGLGLLGVGIGARATRRS